MSMKEVNSVLSQSLNDLKEAKDQVDELILNNRKNCEKLEKLADLIIKYKDKIDKNILNEMVKIITE